MIVKEKNGEGFLDLRICDNLELMAEIKDNTIDLIYCDILYGTGRKFADYQDLKPIRSEIENHYIPRIKEMHRILKSTGSIYLQMDEKIVHWMRCIMDDIFGCDNFRNNIIWHYNRWTATSKDFQKLHDCILRYSKTIEFLFNIEYKQHTENTKKRRENKLTRVEKGNRIEVPFCEKGVPQNDVWCDIPFLPPSSNERKQSPYDTMKPKKLIERIIKASSNEGDLVADFYSGSFTTAEVCKDLKRNFIGCDINPNCLEKAKERGLFSFTDLTKNVD
ncbi:MAG: site-specific DNA-methyltransferase [Chitinophagales bacterium]|nr:site-specific DNA-methyltransferase [Chitinophagales bacterium]